MPPDNRPICDKGCEIVIRLDQDWKNFNTQEKVTMWKKIDELSTTIGVGKNWIIGIMVTLSLNLVGVLASVTLLVLRSH